MANVDFRISIHAQVRFLEKYISSRAVCHIRKEAGSDVKALEILESVYADELCEFRNAVRLKMLKLVHFSKNLNLKNTRQRPEK